MTGRAFTEVRSVRCALFVPGDRQERFDKAEASGVDAVVFDLEDGVGPAAKDAAREAVLGRLAAPTAGPLRCVRINGLATAHGLRDLLALGAAAARPRLVLVPKVEDAAECAIVAAQLGGERSPPLMAVIESARGLAAAPAIAGARAPLAALGFGGADLAADLGAEMAPEPLAFARGAVVAAAATAGLAAFDVPHLDVRDPAGAEQAAVHARRLGFTAKFAIHPAQVEPIQRAFTPDAAAVAHARRVLAAMTGAGGGAAMLDGRMVDAALARAAQRTLARAAKPSPQQRDPEHDR